MVLKVQKQAPAAPEAPVPGIDDAFKAQILSAVKQDPRRTVLYNDASRFLDEAAAKPEAPKVRQLLSMISGVASNKYIGECVKALMGGGDGARILLGYEGQSQDELRKLIDGVSIFPPGELEGVSTEEFLTLVS